MKRQCLKHNRPSVLLVGLFSFLPSSCASDSRRSSFLFKSLSGQQYIFINSAAEVGEPFLADCSHAGLHGNAAAGVKPASPNNEHKLVWRAERRMLHDAASVGGMSVFSCDWPRRCRTEYSRMENSKVLHQMKRKKTKPITQNIKLSERILRSKPTRSPAPNKNHPPDNTVTPAS